jgi:hypothetical protein
MQGTMELVVQRGNKQDNKSKMRVYRLFEGIYGI